MTAGIRLMVGLGNPTPRYERTRHNAGFWFLDRVADHYRLTFRDESRFLGSVARHESGGRVLHLLKPSTYMNRSGQSVMALINYFKIAPEEILVAHDELDLAPGDVRLKKGGGHGGHNGLRDMIAHLGTPDFYRLRFGIGHPGDRAVVTNYVLDAPSRQDEDLLAAAMARALDELPALERGDMTAVMNRLNTGAQKAVDERGSIERE